MFFNHSVRLPEECISIILSWTIVCDVRNTLRDFAIMDPPGFRRVEDPGERPYYRTLPQDGRTPRKLSNRRAVEDYLEKEKRSDVRADLDFDFTRRLKRKSECESGEVQGKKSNLRSDVFADEEECPVVDDGSPLDGRKSSKFTLENLIQSGVKLDDRRKRLHTICKEVRSGHWGFNKYLPQKKVTKYRPQKFLKTRGNSDHFNVISTTNP